MVSSFGGGAEKGGAAVGEYTAGRIAAGRRSKPAVPEATRLPHAWDRKAALREAQDALVDSLLAKSGGCDMFQRLNPVVQKLLSRLERREATVLKMRFGIEDGYPKTWKEIGRRFDWTPEEAEETARKAILKLRFAATPRLYMSGRS